MKTPELPQYFTDYSEASDTFTYYTQVEKIRGIAFLNQNSKDCVICRDQDVSGYIMQGYGEVLPNRR